jgi:hypothetical protein
MNIIEWMKRLYVLPPVEEMMTSELEEARRDLLIAETASDYAESAVIYNRQRIERLTAALLDAAVDTAMKKV